MIFVPLSLLAGSDRDEYEKYIELMRRFNGTKIEIGMSPADVQAIFDDSGRALSESAAHTVRVYGEDAKIGWFPVPSVSIEYERGRVESVWTEYSFEYSAPRNR